MINCVLKTWQEVEDAANALIENRLSSHPDFVKSWDTWKMINFIKKWGKTNSKILDVGCNGSPILPFLHKLDFTELFGCDINLKKRKRRLLRRIKNRITNNDPDQGLNEMLENKENLYDLSIQDLQKTSYENEMFDFITSLSVIEHGVKISDYLNEMKRILKPNGFLLTSTDYWPEKIETSSNIYNTKRKDVIFDQNEIQELVKMANEIGFQLVEPMNYDFKDKVVYWKKTNKRYTFVFFCLQKK